MTQRPEDVNPFDPFGTARQFRDASLDAWSKALQQFVNTDAYAQATGAALDTYLTASAPLRKAIEQTMTQVLQTYNLPSRADVISIAERLTNIETRLDDLDAQITALQRTQQQAQASQQPKAQASLEQAPPAQTAGGQPTLPSDTQEAATAQTMDPVVDTLSESEDGDEHAASGKKRRPRKEQQ